MLACGGSQSLYYASVGSQLLVTATNIRPETVSSNNTLHSIEEATNSVECILQSRNSIVSDMCLIAFLHFIIFFVIPDGIMDNKSEPATRYAF